MALASEDSFFLALWGALQARGRPGFEAGTSRPVQAGGALGGLAGAPGVSRLLPCSVPLPQEPVHGSCQ